MTLSSKFAHFGQRITHPEPIDGTHFSARTMPKRFFDTYAHNRLWYFRFYYRETTLYRTSTIGSATKYAFPLQKKAVPIRARPCKKIPATCYSPAADRHSTIAAEALHFRVRNGNGCYLLAMITGKKRYE